MEHDLPEMAIKRFEKNKFLLRSTKKAYEIMEDGSLEECEIFKLEKYYSNKKHVNLQGKLINTAKAWLEWDGRREYDRLVFKPFTLEDTCPKHYYNTFKGFKCKGLQSFNPAKLDWFFE